MLEQALARGEQLVRSIRRTLARGRRTREANPCHEPAGSGKGGQFARKGSGDCGPSAFDTYGPPKHAMERRVSPTSKYDAVKAEKLFGRRVTRPELDRFVFEMFEDVKAPIMLRYSFTDWGGLRVSGTPLADPGAFDVDRYIIRDDDGTLIAKHQGVTKDKTVPPGFGKDLLRSHLRAYERMGIDVVTMYANITAGPYVWARMGFLPVEDEGYTFLERAFDNVRGRTISERDPVTGVSTNKTFHFDAEAERLITSIMRRNDPKSVWRVAEAKIGDFKVGKAMMIEAATELEEGYSARLRLDNKEQMTKFWAYVGGRTKPTRPQ